MNTNTKPRIGTMVALLLFCSTVQAQTWQWEQQPGESVALKHGDTVVWQFNYGPDQPKPFFHPVALPDGRVITCDRPADHVWHHALWFSWKFINGVNYWEPADRKTGTYAGQTRWSDVNVTTRPDHSAQIEMSLTYRPTDCEPVMTEKRKITVSAPDESGRYHFDWTSTFTAGKQDVVLDRTPLEGEPDGKAWGGYAGLSVRLSNDLAERNADSTDGPIEFNDQSRFRGKALALDYHGLIDGKPLGIAICDHPDNLNHPTPWYVIRSKPMSYYSPAVICYGPHTLKASQTFTLRYRIIAHAGRWTSEQLKGEYNSFVR